MIDRINKLVELAEDAAETLAAYGDVQWATRLRQGITNGIAKIQASDFSGIEHLLASFRGLALQPIQGASTKLSGEVRFNVEEWRAALEKLTHETRHSEKLSDLLTHINELADQIKQEYQRTIHPK